ncbi:rhodanese-like domain protein [hydrothermal vent metagenome]|uniref:Rhodanese-like domain protein n=1 Tax=hydrothermal vent metagenome TaxID=652676 RepID=A0A1W1CWB4_9ZZZZ
MKKIILSLLLLSITLFADLKNQYITKDFLKKNIPIVDIRTPAEWRETGILKGAVPIMFFDQRGKYNAKKFLVELNKKIDTTKPFALICHTGNRTSMVAPWLSKEFGYKVINLQGGMEYATKGLQIPTVPYKH